MLVAPGRAGAELVEIEADLPIGVIEDVCAVAMRAMVGNDPARDDVAVLALHRQP